MRPMAVWSNQDYINIVKWTTADMMKKLHMLNPWNDYD